MTRGIHLKRIKTTDLELLGLKEVPLAGDSRALEPAEQSLLAEIDPTLFKVIDEVRQGLEGTRRLLDEALASRALPADADERRVERA